MANEMTQQTENEAADDQTVDNLSQALMAMAEDAMSTDGLPAGPPRVVIVIAAYEDGSLQLTAGPDYSPEAHMQILGQAGLEVARMMGIDTTPSHDKSRIVVAH